MLMKRNLPTYICNSFVAAGFDTLSVIAEMDVSDSPGNSLQVIENFISKEYPNDPRFYRSNMTCTFFPPGHRQRIASFVKQVKEQLEEERKRKRRGGASNSVYMSKRGKSDGDTSSSNSDSHPSQFSTVGEIRKQVSKWQRQQKDDKLRKLREHEHFEVKVSEGQGEGRNASVSCLVCGKSCARSQKHGKVLISNWTRHAIKCAQSQQFCGTTAHMHRLDEHFSKPRTSSSSSERAYVSSPSPELFSPAFKEQEDKSASEIVHINESTGGKDTQGHVSEDTYVVGMWLYASAYTSISTDTLEVIAQLVHTKEQSIKIQMMNVAQQSGTTDCALYAMAVITCLALGMDPLSVILNRDELRPHLVKSLETRTISIFPVKKHRRPVNRVTKVEICLVYCHCRLPDDGQKMVCCDKCGEWYHLHCISAPIPESDNSWFCSSCTL